MDQTPAHCRYIRAAQMVVLAMGVAFLVSDQILTRTTSQPRKDHHHIVCLRRAGYTIGFMVTVTLGTCALTSTSVRSVTNTVTLGAAALTNRKPRELSELVGTDS